MTQKNVGLFRELNITPVIPELYLPAEYMAASQFLNVNLSINVSQNESVLLLLLLFFMVVVVINALDKKTTLIK